MDGWLTRPGLGQGDPDADLPTLVSVLQHHAHYLGDKRAITFLVDGEEKEESVDFAELFRRARAIGATVAEHAKPGDRALLLFPPGMDYITAFFGCLCAGVIAVPAYPPDPSPMRLKRTLPRLQAIVADAGATVVLTNTMIKGMAKGLFALAPEFAQLTWMATDKLADGAEAAWVDPKVDGDALAFLQYTSGSTGMPRGVMLSHSNLLEDIELIQSKYRHTADSQAIHWLPPYHDMGLIGAILTPFAGGFPSTLLSPFAFLRKPIRWLNAISRTPGGDISGGGPNFAFELCVRKTTPEERAAMDLSNWRVAYTGAEPIRASTLRRFAAAFEPAGFRPEFFYPCYGLAEATLLVTGVRKGERPIVTKFDAAALDRRKVQLATDEAPSRELVSCGTSGGEHTLVIVDPATGTRAAPDAVGELWVKGPIVARGYWNRPERTEAEFRCTLDGDGPFLRTGDLSFVHDGEVYIAGRIKDMIIIRGVNHYPQDVEETVETAHPYVRKGCVAAFAYDRDEEEHLGVVTEVDAREADFDGHVVLEAIRRSIIQKHQVEPSAIVLIAAKSIPKTSSGKIQRFAARLGWLEGTLDVVAEHTA